MWQHNHNDLTLATPKSAWSKWELGGWVRPPIAGLSGAVFLSSLIPCSCETQVFTFSSSGTTSSPNSCHPCWRWVQGRVLNLLNTIVLVIKFAKLKIQHGTKLAKWCVKVLRTKYGRGLHVREDYLYQFRWIFGKLPNGLWPPPYFRKKMLRFCPGNRCP